jgi:2-amino-4-hydroxy-6-hydroxymethyldihydropteridine diphosphokinase
VRHPPSVYIGLGSNQGDRRALLAQGLSLLAEAGFGVEALSSLYLTEPVDAPPQGWFLNAVAAGATSLSPEELLSACLQVERRLGRERIVHHGPRTLDLDILIYGEELRQGPALTLPHPRLHERRFVLTPLCELAPELRHPRLGVTIRDLLADCPDTSRVVRLPAESEARP